MNNAQRDVLVTLQHERIEAIQGNPIARIIVTDPETGVVTFVRHYPGVINRVLIDMRGTVTERFQRTRGHVTPLELAGSYVAVLREWMDSATFEMLLCGDLSDADNHTDTNMVMSEAFTRCHGRMTWLPSDVEENRCTQGQADNDDDLWNDAFTLVNMHANGGPA